MKLEETIRILYDAGAEFVVIGGAAMGLQGSAHLTKDIDFCYARTNKNMERLAMCYPNCGDSTNLRKKLVWNDWESPPRVQEHASRRVGSPAYNSRGLRGMCWEATRSSPVNVEST